MSALVRECNLSRPYLLQLPLRAHISTAAKFVSNGSLKFWTSSNWYGARGTVFGWSSKMKVMSRRC